ncbi:MAG: molybdenum cofactor guanylyltransferase, partial [Candidatus Kapaibacteriota bacterium]
MLKNAISFAILSGGKSSRIGVNKAFLEIEGVPLIQRALLLANSFPEKMIITNTPELYSKFDCQVYPDIFLNRGPISGIHSALL